VKAAMQATSSADFADYADVSTVTQDVGSTVRITSLSIDSSFRCIADPTLLGYGTDFIATYLEKNSATPQTFWN
jgi:hypothetical protein